MYIEQFLPFGLRVEDGLVLMAAISAFGAVFAVWNALLVRDPTARRAKEYRRRKEELKAGWVKAKGNATNQRVSMLNVMKTAVKRFDLMRSKTTTQVSEKLVRAGWRSKDAVVTFLAMKLALPFVFGSIGFVLFNVMGVGELSDNGKLLAPLLATGLGAYAPEMFVKNAIQKRQQALQKGLPDALDLLVICAEAGLSLDAGMTRVANEMAKASPEIADEFRLTALELGFLPQRRKALENLLVRCQLPAFRGVINTLLQTEKYGTPLAQSLRVLSAEFRSERMLKAEEKAARLPALLTLPLMVFILPTLFIVLLGPAGLRIMEMFSKF
jgi:tight adherence protein C